MKHKLKKNKLTNPHLASLMAECKESTCQIKRHRFDPRSGRSPGEGNCKPLQYSCLGNPMTEEPGEPESILQRVGHDSS